MIVSPGFWRCIRGWWRSGYNIEYRDKYMKEDNHITYKADSIIDNLGMSEEEINELMEMHHHDLSDEDYFNVFDKTMDIALSNLHLFANNWRNQIITENVFDAYSCALKLSRVLQLTPGYIFRSCNSLLRERKNIDLSYQQKISEIRSQLETIHFRFSAFFSNEDDTERNLKMSENNKMIKIVLPKLLERTYDFATIQSEKLSQQKTEQKTVLRYKLMNLQAEAGVEDSKIRDIYQIDLETQKEVCVNFLKYIVRQSELIGEHSCLCVDFLQLPCVLIDLLSNLWPSIDIFASMDKYKILAYEEAIETVKKSEELKRIVQTERNTLLFHSGLNNITKEDCEYKIKELRGQINTGLGILYVKFIDNIPMFVTKLREQNASQEEISKLLINIALLDYFEELKKSLSIDLEEHPLAPFIRKSDKVEAILDWLHRAIMGQQQAKDQIAPIKAAMDCKPQAVNSTLPFVVFNSEFHLEVTEGTWNNWIKGYHKAKYADGELDCYISELEEIMKS